LVSSVSVNVVQVIRTIERWSFKLASQLLVLAAADASFLVKVFAIAESKIFGCFQFNRRENVSELGTGLVRSLTWEWAPIAAFIVRRVMKMSLDMMEELGNGLEDGRNHLGSMHDGNNAQMRCSLLLVEMKESNKK